MDYATIQNTIYQLSHEEVLDLIDSAIDLAKTEIAQICDSEEGSDTADITRCRTQSER
jgi:hypothetical protein